MAGACSIYIVFPEQFEIFSHQFFGHVMPCKFVVFMNINPLHQYRLTVNQELFVFNFSGSESNFNGCSFERFSGFVFEFNTQRIKIRFFSRPFFYSRDFFCECYGLIFIDENRFCFRSCNFTGCIFQCITNRKFVFRLFLIFQGHVQRKLAVGISGIQWSVCEEIGYVSFGARIHIHIAIETRKPPEVLTFQVIGIREPVKLNCKHIFTGFDFIGNIYSGRKFSFLIHSNKGAVEVVIGSTFGSIGAQYYFFANP